jgi:hypothetical protein
LGLRLWQELQIVAAVRAVPAAGQRAAVLILEYTQLSRMVLRLSSYQAFELK